MSPVDNTTANCVPAEITIIGNRGRAIDGQIWSVSERFLRLTLQEPIEAGELLEMSIHGCNVSGEVAFCQPCPWGYNVGVQLLDRHSMRREPRFPLDLPATLTVIGCTGPKEAVVRITDVSASGLGLFSAVPLQVGICVEINLELGLLFGEIRHCQQSDDHRFRIGVAIYYMTARQQPKVAKLPLPRFGWLRRSSGFSERGA